MNKSCYVAIQQILQGYSLSLKCIKVKKTKKLIPILDFLKKSNYIKNYNDVESDPYNLIVWLLYTKNGLPVVKNIKQIAKRKVFYNLKLKTLESLYYYPGTFVLTTSKGILTHRQACDSKIGGKFLFYIS